MRTQVVPRVNSSGQVFLRSSDSWAEISPYLDEVLDLEPQARDSWLSALQEREPQLAPTCEPIWPSLANCSDGQFEGQAAVKLLNPALVGHPTARRFAREGRVLAKVQHANIAHLLDAGVAAGQPYLILEYVRGESIDLYCEAHDIAVLLSGMGEIRQALAASESVNRHLDERDSVVYTLSYAALLMRMGDPAAALRALDGVVDRARASGNQVSLLYALLKAGGNR